MHTKQQSKQEYMARINRVMDYIRLNIDQALNLNTLAGIASFSPYHFHRIFTAVVGETHNNFVMRIKLEKAAQFFQNDPKLSVLDVATYCGFINLSSFSRAFKGYFNRTINEFRNQEKTIYVKDGIRYSKG